MKVHELIRWLTKYSPKSELRILNTAINSSGDCPTFGLNSVLGGSEVCEDLVFLEIFDNTYIDPDVLINQRPTKPDLIQEIRKTYIVTNNIACDLWEYKRMRVVVLRIDNQAAVAAIKYTLSMMEYHGALMKKIEQYYSANAINYVEDYNMTINQFIDVAKFLNEYNKINPL